MAWYDFLLNIVLGWLDSLWRKVKKWFGEQKLRIVKWVTGGYLTLSFWFGAQKTRIIKWVTSGWSTLTKWFNQQKTKIIKWVTSGWSTLTKWFDRQKTKIIKWVTGGFLTLAKWYVEQMLKTLQWIFGQWGNLEKWWAEQDRLLKKAREIEAESTILDAVQSAFDPDHESKVQPGVNFFDHASQEIIPMSYEIMEFLANHAKDHPNELADFADGMAGTLLFEEVVPLTPKERARERDEKMMEWLIRDRRGPQKLRDLILELRRKHGK